MDIVFKQFFKAGASFRNPSLWKHFKALKRSESCSLLELKQLQEERLFQLLQFAAENSPYYKKLFTDLGMDGSSVSMEDFYRIPVISKTELLAQNKKIHREKKFEKEFFCETSGTSGQVLTFLRNESWDSFNRASIMRGYSWHGVFPWNFNLYFWGYNTKKSKRLKIRLFDFLVNRYRIFDYSEKKLLSLEKKIKRATYIEGYSSMIYELATLLEHKKMNVSKIRMVKGTSEKIYPHYQDTVKKVFGKKMISEYGAAESGIIAFECSKGNMHINMEGVYIETDENNEIIVTNLFSRSFPVIRYRLGDIVKLAPESKKCSCGLAHPIIEEISGRVGKNIYGYKKKYPSLTFYYIFKNIYFGHHIQLNYQAHQYQKGKLEIWLKEEITEKIRGLINREAEKYFGNDVHIELKQNNNFRVEAGKLRDFISEINQ